VIRLARLEDAATLGDILHDWVEATPWMPNLHKREDAGHYIAGLIESADVYVIEGLHGFLVRDGEEVRLLHLAEAARGRRYGARLLDLAKDGRNRLTLWTFQANEGARRFYIREGFREVELTDGSRNEEQLPDVRLEWLR
jgi:GNAT superfamily N-acetyltransferase